MQKSLRKNFGEDLVGWYGAPRLSWGFHSFIEYDRRERLCDDRFRLNLNVEVDDNVKSLQL